MLHRVKKVQRIYTCLLYTSLGQYETEDADVEMLREMAKDTGGYSDEI